MRIKFPNPKPVICLWLLSRISFTKTPSSVIKAIYKGAKK